MFCAAFGVLFRVCLDVYGITINAVIGVCIEVREVSHTLYFITAVTAIV